MVCAGVGLGRARATGWRAAAGGEVSAAGVASFSPSVERWRLGGRLRKNAVPHCLPVAEGIHRVFA